MTGQNDLLANQEQYANPPGRAQPFGTHRSHRTCSTFTPRKSDTGGHNSSPSTSQCQDCALAKITQHSRYRGVPTRTNLRDHFSKFISTGSTLKKNGMDTREMDGSF